MRKSLFMMLLIGCFTVGLYIPSASAQESQELQITDMVETKEVSLLNAEVVTASKKEEGIQRAPGIINVVSGEEIERLGADNIMEAIERVAGIYTLGSYFAPMNTISVRGDLSTHYNNHVLILLNGRPLREMLIGGVDFPIFLAMPLQSVDHIEVIRGPGSVLYGTNAYTGVVNIITKKTEDQGDASARVQAGSFGTKAFELSMSKKKGGLNANGGLLFKRKEGWGFEAVGEDGKVMKYNAGHASAGTVFSLSYKNLSVQSFVAASQQDHTGVLPLKELIIPFIVTSGDTTIIEKRNIMPPFKNRKLQSFRSFLDVGYDAKLSAKHSLLINATSNMTQIRFATPNGDWVGNASDLLLEGTETYKSSSGAFNYLVGVSSYTQTGIAEIGDADLLNDGRTRGIAQYSKTWYSAYAQAEILPIERVKFILGGQFNKPTGQKLDFVPRLGAVMGFSERFSAKLLYGQAFRSPTEIESNLADPPVLVGNRNLKPEKAATFDAQLTYSSEAFHLSATYFRTAQKNIITQDSVLRASGFMVQYVNKAALTFEGGEIEAKYQPSKRVFFTGSVSYQEEVSEKEPDTYTSPLMLKLGGFYKANQGASLGLFASHFSKPRVVPASASPNPEPAAYTFVTAKLNMDVSQLLKMKREKMSVNLYITNLLNEKIYYPEFVRGEINAIPGRAGRGFDVSLNLKF